MESENINPVHPGEVLLEEFLKPMELSQNQLALSIQVPARRINEIVHGKRRITADTALRLVRYFNMSPQFWLGLQMDYDLDIAEDELGPQLERDTPVRKYIFRGCFACSSSHCPQYIEPKPAARRRRDDK